MFGTLGLRRLARRVSARIASGSCDAITSSVLAEAAMFRTARPLRKSATTPDATSRQARLGELPATPHSEYGGKIVGALQASSSFWFGADPEVCVHTCSYLVRPLLEIPIHTHDEYNFVFCLKGVLCYEVRGRIWHLEAGDMLVINPGDLHRSFHVDLGEVEGVTLHMSAPTFRRLIHRMRLPAETNTRMLFEDKARIPELVPIFRELQSEIAVTRNGSDLLAQSLVLKLMVLLVRHALEPRIVAGEFCLPRQLPSWQMVRALEYMNRTGKSAFSLPEMCAEAGSSVSRFIPLFKNSCQDISPTVFHNRLLMQKAERLLEAGDCPIKEVSLMLGFQNESHFCKTFRQSTGASPGAWRAQKMF